MSAIETLADSTHVKPFETDAARDFASPGNDAQLDRCIEAAAAWFGFEAEPAEIPYERFARFIRTAGPMLICLPDGSLLALDGRGRVIGPDLTRRRIGADPLRATIFCEQEKQSGALADRILAACHVANARRSQVREKIVREDLKDASQSATCWQLRLRPDAGISHQLRGSGLTRRVIALTLAHAVEYVVWVAAWAIVGQGALRGRLDRGWLVGWSLLLLTVVPLRSTVTWLQGQIAVRAGGWLKEYLLAGALRLDPDAAARMAAGQLLGRVVEGEAMESLALGGGFLALISTIELAAALVIAVIAGTTLLFVLLVGWVLLSGVLIATYLARCSRWAGTRLEMTDDLVEHMVGHRTRLAQEPEEAWHKSEDQWLESYFAASRSLDAFAPLFNALLPRGWLIAGLAAIGPAFVVGAMSPERLAASLGAIVLAVRAFRKLGAGAPLFLQAVVAWRQLRPLFNASQRDEPRTSPALACSVARPRNGDVILEARDVVFQHRDRAEPVLRGCSFQVRAGDRILLDGPSGGGKSTLASVIAGVQRPTAGLVLASGLDRAALGAQGWRRRVASAPQFHENHLITGSLAFNLLMSRSGSLTASDIEEAETVCIELGLGELLKTMPSGIMQMVGESGWQLSDGERSRVFIARALLQKADLVILDESFAALDTVNLRRAMTCVEKRATAVLAIAHP